ncbi:MAG: hypothetical protein JNM84_10500 [Planctomycetes bacterium]|nr:hypothetical protein [Planctomycetota bacterium]
MESYAEAGLGPVAGEIFGPLFSRYFRTAARLRRLPYRVCRREAEDIRSEALVHFLEARASRRSADESPEALRRLAVKALARACYSVVERQLRHVWEECPETMRARGLGPIEELQREDLRRAVRRCAPRVGAILMRGDSLLTTGRINKRSLHRLGGVSRRSIERELARLRLALQNY